MKRHSGHGLGGFGLLAALGLGSVGNIYERLPYASNTTRRPGKRYPFSSERQIARNKRQFEAGQIRFEPQRKPA